MENLTVVRVLQAAVGIVLIAEYIRRLIARKSRDTAWLRYRGFFLLAGGIVLLTLGVWGELPSLK